MLNGTVPGPEKNLGQLVECKPSERDLWRRDDKFKVSDVSALPSGCPAPTRLPIIEGKLSLSRRICEQTIAKGPDSGKFNSCTEFVNRAAGATRQVECTKDDLYVFA